MGADDRELVVGDSLEAGSLWEDFPQLDVVFLAAALLPGLQRVAVVDGAAPASVHASLDRLVVEELGPPVSCVSSRLRFSKEQNIFHKT